MENLGVGWWGGGDAQDGYNFFFEKTLYFVFEKQKSLGVRWRKDPYFRILYLDGV